MRKGILNLGSADINIEINTGDAGETPDAISEAIETNKAEEVVENYLNTLDEQLDALDNVEASLKFIKKFSITKDGLYLLNVNGAFNSEIGCFIPSVEEDSETGEVTEPTDEEIADANVNINVTVEGLEEKFAKIKEVAIKTLETLIKAFQEFYTKMVDSATSIKNSLSKNASKVKDKLALKAERFKNQKVRLPKFEAVSKAVEKINAAIARCKWLRGEGEIYDVEFDKDPYIVAALDAIGYGFEDGYIVEKDEDFIEPEEGTIGSLGWDKGLNDKTFNLFSDALGRISTMSKGSTILEKVKGMFSKKPDTDKEVLEKGKTAAKINKLFAVKLKTFGTMLNGIVIKIVNDDEEKSAAA